MSEFPVMSFDSNLELRMCGRYVRYSSWKELHDDLSLTTFTELSASYNVAPTQQVLVAREKDGVREGVAMRRGPDSVVGQGQEDRLDQRPRRQPAGRCSWALSPFLIWQKRHHQY